MYVDAIVDKDTNTVKVVERVNGKRKFIEYPVKYKLYYQHASGSNIGIDNKPAKKFETDQYNKMLKFKKDLESQNKKIYEDDIKPISRVLEENYMNAKTPILHLRFFDIEVDFDIEKGGFAKPENPTNKITAISVYLSEFKQLVTLTIPPKSISKIDAENMLKDIPNVFVFEDEKEMINAFFDLIDDGDVLSGWNSRGFDIPYMINRVKKLFGDDYTKKFCLWDKYPIEKEVIKFNKKSKTYDIVGRIHLDYYDLYKKHSGKELHSYKLDYVGHEEVGENKTEYSGTLDDLYNKDYYNFIVYNRQDTMILVKLDEKLKFIELSNNVAHTNTVTIPVTLGSVQLIDQAIINEFHKYNYVVTSNEIEEESEIDDNNDNDDEEDKDIKTGVAGAFVLHPKTGLHDYVGAVDINSLYPSAIRTFNMSPETLVGQLRLTKTSRYISDLIKNGYTSADAWGTIFTVFEYDNMINKTNETIIVDFEDGVSKEFTGKQLYNYIFDPNNYLCITANGTIFSTKKQGVIPILLERWYNERKQMQAKAKGLENLLNGISIPDDILNELI